MTPSPIAKVLSTILKHRVRALLMGGQACILYGAAEFSRDVDLAVLAEDKNLERLRQVFAALRAEQVLFPSLERAPLLRGHACHFRSTRADMEGLRIDVMSVLHGCADFPVLWKRRNRIQLPGVGEIAVLALPDLVTAKKTQRDKDWPMIRRLVEVDYHNRPARPGARRIAFWLQELRSAPLLVELCQSYPAQARKLASSRPLLAVALKKDTAKVVKRLRSEEDATRAADRLYWQPLRDELFAMRQASRGQGIG